MLKKYPFYIRSTVVLFGIILLVYLLQILREIIVPLAFALLLATLLNPLANGLQKKLRLPRVVAIAAAIIAGIIVITAIAWFLFAELRSFADQLPLLKHKLTQLLVQLQQLASTRFGIPVRQQEQYLSRAENGLQPMVGVLMGSAMGTLAMIVLLPVYTFLFLYYKKLLLTFLYEVFASENETAVGTVLVQTKGAIQSYMFGLLLEALSWRRSIRWPC